MSRTVQVNGTLSPGTPAGGELVQVSTRSAKSRSWRSEVVTVASNGTFTITRRIKGKTYFVAQWAGDDDRAGAGALR